MQRHTGKSFTQLCRAGNTRRCGHVGAFLRCQACFFPCVPDERCTRWQVRHVTMSTTSRLLRQVPQSASSDADGVASSDVGTSGTETETCLLCDTVFTSWNDHCSEPSHVARTAICHFFVMPERSESLMQQLEKHIALNLKEVDALALKKVERRRRRLLAGLLHLVEEGVLQCSLPCPAVLSAAEESAAPGTRSSSHMADFSLAVHADRFLTRLLAGEAFMRREIIDRCARLMPSITGRELEAVTTYLTSARQLARLFDELSLQRLLDAYTAQTAKDVSEGAEPQDGLGEPNKPSCGSDDDASTSDADGVTAPAASATSQRRLSRDEKASVLLACLGELEHFHRQDRPRSMASKAAADALVLNVLATHARDNLLSELIHEALQRIIDEGSPVWRQHNADVQRRTAAAAMAPSSTNASMRPSRHRDRSWRSGAQPRRGERDALVLTHSRHAPLSPVPTARDSSPSSRCVPGAAAAEELSAAAAAQLLSSYVTFRDVDDGTSAKDASPDGGVLGAPVYVSATHFAAKNWEPLEKELESRRLQHRKQPWVAPTPRLRLIPGGGKGEG